MPIYEFCCKACSKDFEEICRKGTSHVKCPECGSGKVERKLSKFAFSSGSSGSRNDSAAYSSGASTGSGCGSCVSRSCSTCH